MIEPISSPRKSTKKWADAAMSMNPEALDQSQRQRLGAALSPDATPASKRPASPAPS